MVTTGFRNIYVAKYSNTGSIVSYTGFQKLARARGFSLDVGTSDDNSYYADDTLAETESGASFTSGTLELTVDGLTGEEEARWLEAAVEVLLYHEICRRRARRRDMRRKYGL